MISLKEDGCQDQRAVPRVILATACPLKRFTRVGLSRIPNNKLYRIESLIPSKLSALPYSTIKHSFSPLHPLQTSYLHLPHSLQDYCSTFQNKRPA